MQKQSVVILLCFGKVFVEKIPKYQNLTCGSLCVWASISPDIQQWETLASFLSVGNRFWKRLYLQRDKAALRCGLSERLLPLSDDNQEHLVWAGAYLSPAPSELWPQLFREMAAFIFLHFLRDLLLDINFSTRLFRKSGELKERSGERALMIWGNSIAGKISSSALCSLMEV